MESLKDTLDNQDFRFFISTQNHIFMLEAHQKSTGKTFIIQLEGDSIGQSTNGLFSTVEKMAQGLKAAISGTCNEGLEFTIDSQGRLTFSALFKAGMIEKREGFTLNLFEKTMEPVEMFNNRLSFFKAEIDQYKKEQERKMESLQARNEERFDRLETMMRQMTQRLDLLQKLYEDPKRPLPLQPSISFNSTSVYASRFALTDNNKTAISISGTHSCLGILPQVPLSGQSSYSLRINSDIKNWTCFGITTETGNVNWNENQYNYRYWTFDGRIYGRATKPPTGNGPFGGKDAAIKMVIDMDRGILTFFVGNQQVNSCKIDNSENYSVYISLGNPGDSVTLL